MKQLILIIGIILSVFGAMAQKNKVQHQASSHDLINYTSGDTLRKFIPPPAKSMLKSGGSVKTEFRVSTVNLPEEAKQALDYALAVWSELVLTTVPVNVYVKMEPLDANILAKSRPASFNMNFEGALHQNVYYPVALAEKLSGEEMNPNSSDIICSFNQNIPWYFGTDGNTPETHYDFVTAVLHEIAHGLGFSGFFKDDGSKGYLNNGNKLPGIYDFYVFNSVDLQLANTELFPSPSVQLHNELVSGKLRFVASAENEKNARISNVYSPPVWNDGASIYHLADEVGLMMPFAVKGLAVHHPGNEVITILEEMGWEAPVFVFNPLKDFEEPCAGLPVDVGLIDGNDLNDVSVQIIFSTDNFKTSKSAELSQVDFSHRFQGEIPLHFSTGKVDYYFEAKTENGKSYKFPSSAPVKRFAFKIGPDYIPPVVAHNPQKIVSPGSENLLINALVTDNLGVKTVKVEYRLNGVLQPPLELKLTNENDYSGALCYGGVECNYGKLEYRVVAEDKSAAGNKKYLPSTGFYSVDVFQALDPVKSYASDFEAGSSDFVGADFSISRMVGFSDNILHTVHPYPVSAFKNEKYNLVAQLKYPVILEEGGEMRFNEVVLVEPGEPGADFSGGLFWDYVVVEGSKDNGFTWTPFAPGYDSGSNETWETAFVSSMGNNKSQAVGTQSMFLKNVIQLAGNAGFSAGDTVLFRFRLASDNSLNGWGWAIDNLEIQTSTITDSDLVVQKPIHVYPNPFDSKFFLDFSALDERDQIEILVTDIFGKTVWQKNGLTSFGGPEPIELPNLESGIYLVKAIEEGKLRFTAKVMKK